MRYKLDTHPPFHQNCFQFRGRRMESHKQAQIFIHPGRLPAVDARSSNRVSSAQGFLSNRDSLKDGVY
jgi:hypothetical protein